MGSQACKGLQFPGAPKEEGVTTLKLWAEQAPVEYPWALGRELWLPLKTHMSIHSLVARQAGLVGVLGEVCWVRVYQHSLGPKVLGNGYLRENRKGKVKKKRALSHLQLSSLRAHRV